MIKISAYNIIYLILLSLFAPLRESAPDPLDELTINVTIGVGDCKAIMEKEKLDFRYPAIVAHGTHSLTLNDIRWFFNPSAGEDNGIPVVNENITQTNSLLPNAPLLILNKGISVPVLWGIDRVFNHMDDENYGIKNANHLDSIVHIAHMMDIWTKASKHYHRIKKNPPRTPGFCACAKNMSQSSVNNHSIHQFMERIALKFRRPEEVFVVPPGSTDPPFAIFVWNRYQLDDPTDNIVLSSNLHITSEETWEKFKLTLGEVKDEKTYQLALFLYCKLG